MAYSVKELEKMTDDEIKEISLRKHKSTGLATKEALNAQQILYERSHTTDGWAICMIKLVILEKLILMINYS